jgi:hypothetical protein
VAGPPAPGGVPAPRQAPEYRQVTERVVERAGGAGEQHLAGSAAQRLFHGELAVGDILAHRVTQELDAGRSQLLGRLLVQRVEVAHDRLRRGSKAGEVPSASVGRQKDVRPGCKGAMPVGVTVLAVKEDDCELALDRP